MMSSQRARDRQESRRKMQGIPHRNQVRRTFHKIGSDNKSYPNTSHALDTHGHQRPPQGDSESSPYQLLIVGASFVLFCFVLDLINKIQIYALIMFLTPSLVINDNILEVRSSCVHNAPLHKYLNLKLLVRDTTNNKEQRTKNNKRTDGLCLFQVSDGGY